MMGALRSTRFRALLGSAVSLLTFGACQAVTGVNDLEVVSEQEYEATPEPGNDRTRDDSPPDEDSDDTGDDDGIGPCLEEMCSSEAEDCAFGGCSEILGCIVGCDPDDDTCVERCSEGYSEEDVSILAAYVSCAVGCDDGGDTTTDPTADSLETCLMGARVTCDCGALAGADCAPEDQGELDTCCAEGDSCVDYDALVCLGGFDPTSLDQCLNAFENCVPQ